MCEHKYVNMFDNNRIETSSLFIAIDDINTVCEYVII